MRDLAAWVTRNSVAPRSSIRTAGANAFPRSIPNPCHPAPPRRLAQRTSSDEHLLSLKVTWQERDAGPAEVVHKHYVQAEVDTRIHAIPLRTHAAPSMDPVAAAGIGPLMLFDFTCAR